EGRPEELDEIVGYHLERSYGLRAELGEPNRALERLAAEAGQHLGDAGLRACKRGDAPAAINLLRRATGLLPPSALRWELQCELAIGLRASGELTQAEELLAATVDASEAAGEARVALRAKLELANIGLHQEPPTPAEELLELSAIAKPVFAALGDHRSLGRTW